MKKTMLFAIMGVALAIFSWPQTTVSNSMAIVTVTAYNHVNPGITASGIKVREGIVAMSNDLENRLNMRFGEKVRLEGYGVFEFQDRMARRCRSKVDIFMNSKRLCFNFGVKRNILLVKMV